MTTADEFHTQNQFLQDLKDKYSTNGTKSVYLNEQISSLIDINWWLLLIFIIVAIVFSAFCFLSPNMESWSIYLKIGIIIPVLSYPFWIYPFEKYTLIVMVYIKDMFMGNPYVKPDF